MKMTASLLFHLVAAPAIAKGVDAKGMPQFKENLSTAERCDVLAYTRATFGERAPDTHGNR